MGRAHLAPAFPFDSPLPQVSDSLDALSSLNQRYAEAKRSLLSLDLPIWDTRVRTLSNAEASVAVAQANLYVLLRAESGVLFGRTGTGELVPVDFRTLTGLVSDDLTSFAEHYKINTKLGLLLSIQFQIERAMDDLLRALSLVGPHFEAKAQTLLAAASITAPTTRAAWMYLPSLIRNTLHNGGLHALRNRTITVGRTTFEFRQRRVFEMAGWHHVMHALNAEMDIVEDLFSQASLIQLGSIPDRYAFRDVHGYLPRKPVYRAT